MSTARFIDTNVLVRYAAADHPVHTPLATELFQQLAQGAFEGLLSMTVIFESVFVLERIFDADREHIARSIEIIVAAPGIRFVDDGQRYLAETFEFYVNNRPLSFADCYHAALSLAHCDGEVCTFDKEFSRLPGITRLEPGE